MARFRRIHLHLPLACAVLLLACPVPPALLAVGAALVLLGVAGRVWAAGLLHKGRELCVDGPYRFVRHPLYLGSILGAVGFCLMANSLWAWVLLLPLFLLVYGWQVCDEERALAKRFGEAHAAWARRVPRLWPRLTPAAVESPRPWSVGQVLVNREHYHLLLTLFFVVLFYLKPLLVHAR